ncbi:hypothetical protein BLNAU_6005 [Blattamonas nauphoetae]|uniref:Right handed beta helix domain-containing protein n=1 Tax=Blattamonas nauphoetae TaxID=2049346 RepID=A0ABQ9Y5P4_9EUKA|nr:hypothetical protein BLNAU_6005 [Blattamonas nauphoetae]
MLSLLLIFRLAMSEEESLLSLRVLLDDAKVNISNTEDSFLTELQITNGQYEIASYLVESCTLDLRGNKTRIMHVEGRTEASKPKMKNEGKNGIKAETNMNTMFMFSNSTVSLQNVFLDSGGMGTSVGRLWSSCVLVVGSRMLSNAETSAFVIVGGGSGVGSSVSVIDSVHESSGFGVLLPVVSSISKWLDGERSDRLELLDVGRDGWVSEGGISVCGVGVSVCDVDLVVGSGPLFGVWESDSRCLSLSVRSNCWVWTRLIGSKIWNTTSSGCIRDGDGVRGIAEGIVGCSVWSCTNHLCGTAIVGMGDGGSVLSHNTSFTGCHTPSSPNDDADTDTRHNEHFTTHTVLSKATTLNHVFTLCTFKQCTSDGDGGAIITYFSGLNLQIERCSFHACSSDNNGGVIYLRASLSPPSSFSLSSSSFVDCSTQYFGGCVYISYLSSLTITNCVVLNSTASSGAGALFIKDCSFGDSSGISNTLFQNCTQTNASSFEGGGAVRLWYCATHKLSYVQFRQCYAANGYGHDILLHNTPFDANSFSTCDSTSSKPHRVTSVTTDNSSLLPDTSFEASVESLDSTLTADDTVTLTLTLDRAVSGTMIVIVSNLDGTRQEVDGKAPKIGRVLVFSFSSPSSTVGTCSSSFGESGVLQFPLSDYTLLTASISNHDVSVPSAVVIPDVPPTLLHASCNLDESGTEVEVSFSGFGIHQGPYTLTLNDSITLEVTFQDDYFGWSVGSGWKGVSEKDGELSEKTEYSLTGIMSNVQPSASIKIASGVGFIVPTAARLSTVNVNGFVDARKTTVKLSFESVKLEKNKKYILKMKRRDTSEDTMTREVWTDGNGDVLDVDEILYPFETSEEGRKEQLEFGVSYGVLSLTASDCTRSVLISDIVITMPDEPEVHAIVCSNGGSDEVENCGDSSNPCSSLLVGWRAGQLEDGSETEIVELEVDGEVEMGGVLFVGAKKVRVWGGEKGRGRVLVEWRESWKSTNAIEVDGGLVWIVQVMIVLEEEREVGVEKRRGFVICGEGEVCVERVVVGRVGVGRVGMGLVGLWWGSADLVSIEMEGIEFGDGTRFIEVGSSEKVVSLSVSSLKTRGIRTLNAPLISFCCESEESRVTMEKMRLLETTREESVGGVGVEEVGVVSVRTKQRETRFVGCVFSGSKTRRVGDGEEVGGVLFVGVGGKVGGSVRFEDCVVMDSVAFGREGGGVVVVVSSGVFVVWFSRCWMEETRVSGIGFDCLDGVPQVSSDRAVVSGVGVVGALIVGEELLPIVGRSSSRFSGCWLKVVVGREGGMGGQTNEETKMEL